MTDQETWQEQIRAHELPFKDYVKNVRHFAACPPMADVILWYEYVEYSNNQDRIEDAAREELVQEISSQPDD